MGNNSSSAKGTVEDRVTVIVEDLASRNLKSALRQSEGDDRTVAEETDNTWQTPNALPTETSRTSLPSRSPPTSPNAHKKKKQRRPASSSLATAHTSRGDDLVITSHRLSVPIAASLGSIKIDRRRSKRSGGNYDSVEPTITGLLATIEENQAYNEVLDEECNSGLNSGRAKQPHATPVDDRYISLMNKDGTLLKASASCRVSGSS